MYAIPLRLWCCCVLFLVVFWGHGQDGRRRRIHLSLEDRTVEAWALNNGARASLDNGKQYYWCKGQRIHITQGGADGDLLDGEYVEFHPNGQLRTKGKLSKGERVGTWQDWDVDGRLLRTARWKHGLLHGKQWTFDPKGGEATIKRYRQGKEVAPRVNRKGRGGGTGPMEPEEGAIGSEPGAVAAPTNEPTTPRAKERTVRSRRAGGGDRSKVNGSDPPAPAQQNTPPNIRKHRKEKRHKKEQPVER